MNGSRIHCSISSIRTLNSSPLSVSSKLNGKWAFLKRLYDVGYRASAWLDESSDALGALHSGYRFRLPLKLTVRPFL